MFRVLQRRAVVALLVVGVGLLTGCAAGHPGGGAAATGGVGSGTTSNAPGSGRALAVVAAENFWGDLAAQVGGAHVAVTSVVSDPDADPHLFEPGSRTGLAVAQARLVIANGAGYDDWMTRLLAAAPSRDRQVVTVADVLHVTGADPNPHLWYDTPALPAVVTAIGAALAAADPPDAEAYRTGTSTAIAGLQPLLQAVNQLKAADHGLPVAYTERVPGLLLAAAGLRVLTPPGFARSVEDGTDPAAADVAAMRAVLTGHRVRVLLYNQQATSPITADLQRLARSSSVPVVPVTETQPAATTFQSWQLGQVTALRAALAS
jgi:zinc/manganese transport system substrate-binding protein